MSEKINDDVFTRLLDTKFNVELTRGDTVFKLAVRELPFSTFTFILTEYVNKARAELLSSRQSALDQIGSVGHLLSQGDLMQLIDQFTPLLITAIYELPGAVKRVLMDTVIDITEQQAEALTPEDVVVIVEGVVNRLNPQRIADKVTKVFFRFRDMANLVQAQIPAVEEPQNNASTEAQLS